MKRLAITLVLLLAMAWGAVELFLPKPPPPRLAEPFLVRVMKANPNFSKSVNVAASDGRALDLIEDPASGETILVVSGADDERAFRFAPTPESGDDAPYLSVRDDEPTVPAPKAAPRPNGVTFIDLLIVGDARAEKWIAKLGISLRDFAALSVARMNKVLANSGIGSRFAFRLVDVMPLGGETDANPARVLAAMLTGSSVGSVSMAQVRRRRDAVGADIVIALNVSDYTLAGVAATGPVQIGERLYSERAYCVCSAPHVVANNTMIHEVGHLLGAGHSTEQPQSPGPGRFEYSAGYYAQNWCTIMAYNNERHPVRIPNFSNPAILHGGVATGDALHDNARTLAECFLAVSNFRGASAARRGEITASRTIDLASATRALARGGAAVAESARRVGKSTVSLDDLYSRMAAGGGAYAEDGNATEGAPPLADGAVLNFDSLQMELELVRAYGEDIEIDLETLPDGVRLMQLPNGVIIPAHGEDAAREKSQLILYEDMDDGFISGSFNVRFTDFAGEHVAKVKIEGLMFEGGEAAGVASVKDSEGVCFVTIAPEDESPPPQEGADASTGADAGANSSADASSGADAGVNGREGLNAKN